MAEADTAPQPQGGEGELFDELEEVVAAILRLLTFCDVPSPWTALNMLKYAASKPSVAHSPSVLHCASEFHHVQSHNWLCSARWAYACMGRSACPAHIGTGTSVAKQLFNGSMHAATSFLAHLEVFHCVPGVLGAKCALGPAAPMHVGIKLCCSEAP